MAGTSDQSKKPMAALAGADFSQVRAHTGAGASAASAGVGASAYATGKDIHFGAPGAGAGGGLLGHEAAHVIQQRAGVADINAAVGHYAR